MEVDVVLTKLFLYPCVPVHKINCLVQQRYLIENKKLCGHGQTQFHTSCSVASGNV